MTIYSGIFNSVRDSNGKGDRIYDAWWFAKYFSTFIGNGVFPNPSTNLQVEENGKMTVKVRAGSGWIDGYFLYSDSDYVLQLDIADGVLKRIDRVVMRLNYLTRQIEIAVKKGTFANNPKAPTLQRDTDYHELALADVLITNGATQVTQAEITDTRLNSNLCGIVKGTVDQVDTTTIFNQYQSWFNVMKLDKEKEFDDWIALEQEEFDEWIKQLQDVLDENAAGNLLNLINANKNSINNLAGQGRTIETVKSNADAISKNTQDIIKHSEAKASLTEYGHTKLSNSVNSEMDTLAATPKAVKIAYDLAQSAKTDGNNVKVNTVDALLQVDESLPITSTSSWVDIITQIGNISTGKKFASGKANSSNTMEEFKRYNQTVLQTSITISGLDFLPSYILLHCPTRTNDGLVMYFPFDIYKNNVRIIHLTPSELVTGNPGNNYMYFYLLSGNASVSYGGFTLPSSGTRNLAFDWYAFE